jgi:hypothetical protein
LALAIRSQIRQGITPPHFDVRLVIRCSPARRSKKLEAELKVVKAASAIFEDGAVDPNASSRLSEG